MEPEILLMDEPFAALRCITKRGLQQRAGANLAGDRKTLIYVTHDIVEALLLGTRVGVMTAGPAARIKNEIPRRYSATTRRPAAPNSWNSCDSSKA